MEFLTSVMRGEVLEPMALGQGEGYQEIQMVQPSVSTRRASAVDIGKRYGMWTDKFDLTHRSIEVTIGDYDDEY